MVFADYVRPAARLAALMGVPVIYVFTHDSFCVGEGGPTHQSTDATEVVEAWKAALNNETGPTALCF